MYQVGEFVAEEWDLSRPLWDTLLVENYRGEDGTCAIVARGYVAHSSEGTIQVADGLA